MNHHHHYHNNKNNVHPQITLFLRRRIYILLLLLLQLTRTTMIIVTIMMIIIPMIITIPLMWTRLMIMFLDHNQDRLLLLLLLLPLPLSLPPITMMSQYHDSGSVGTPFNTFITYSCMTMRVSQDECHSHSSFFPYTREPIKGYPMILILPCHTFFK